jgi:hypothetical protein
MQLCNWAIDSVKRLWRWFFPKQIEMDECLKNWLAHVFPDLDLDRVRFYEGLPLFIKGSKPNAITLPSIWGASKINIYFRDAPDPCSCAGLTLIAHEMVHVRQYMDYGGGYGLGFARLFMIPYLMCSVSHGYRDNPLEVEAYDFDARIRGCCSTSNLPCDCSVSPPAVNASGLSNWISNCGSITMDSTSVGFFDHLSSCVPGFEAIWEAGKRVWSYCSRFFRSRNEALSGNRDDSFSDVGTIGEQIGRLAGKVFAVWAQTVFVCIGTSILAILLWVVAIIYAILANLVLVVVILLIAIVWAIVDVLSVIVTAVWALIAGILCLLDAIWWVLKKIWEGILWLWEKIKALWNWFKGVLSKVCTWSEEAHEVCTEWADEGSEECSEWADEGSEECSKWADEGSEKCTAWEACKWYTPWNCIAGFFCKGWYWVAKWVCKGWYWVAKWVCKGWYWVAKWVCKGFTWVVGKLTCW